nr:hypothetical protein [Clostridia bacterium]
MRENVLHGRNVILGTDWWTDCDDAAAIRILARAHLAGRFRVLGIVINACFELSVPSLDAYLVKEGLSGVPLALDRYAVDFGRNPPYQAGLLKYPHGRENGDAEDPVRLYRRLIAAADAPVDILEIGYPQALAAFLESPGDDISPLTGHELAALKCGHLWMMAGRWDQNPGLENNFARNVRASRGGEAVCRLWPGEIVFLGYEVGMDVLTGGKLAVNDILAGILRDHGSPSGRASWDPMLVELALCGDVTAAAYTAQRGWASVDPETGENRFKADPLGRHCFVARREPIEYYRDRIDRLIASECE